MNLQNFGCYAVKHFKEVKNNRFVCPVLRFLSDMKPWFFAKAFRWRVAPCGAEVALRSPGGVAWHVFFMMFWMLRLRDVLSPLAGCNDRGTWCLIQFTSVHVQMAVTRPLSCGVIWNSCRFKMWLRCVILLLYISLDFTSVRPFSPFFLAGQDDFPGRKMKDPRLGASNWSHHMIDIVQTCWTTNQTKVWMKTLFFYFHSVHFVPFPLFQRPRWGPTRE